MLTFLFFTTLIIFPQHEPQYLPSDAHLFATKPARPSPPQKRLSSCVTTPLSTRDTPPSRTGLNTHSSPSCTGGGAGQAQASPRNSSVWLSPEGLGGGVRVVRLPAAIGSRPRLVFFAYDDGFDRSSVQARAVRRGGVW